MNLYKVSTVFFPEYQGRLTCYDNASGMIFITFLEQSFSVIRQYTLRFRDIYNDRNHKSRERCKSTMINNKQKEDADYLSSEMLEENIL